jgi:dihydropteroate synthase-like protein
MSSVGKILLLTGRMAFNDIKELADQYNEVDVDVLPISVAAFTTTKLVQRHGPGFIAKHNSDLVMVSGMAQGDYTGVGDKIGTRVLKGTKNVSGLVFLLNNMENLVPKLSPIEPADEIIREEQNAFYQKYVQDLESKVSFDKRNFRLLSGTTIGIDMPPRVLAEVADVTLHPIEKSLEKAKELAKFADIIDLGSNIEHPDPERIAELVSEIRKIGLPVSVDTLDPDEILAGVDAGAELILSIDRGNIEEISRIPEDVALVCLPTNVSKGIFPSKPLERAKACQRICADLTKRGYQKLLADPLMEAAINPGLMNSLTAYYLCRQLESDRPFLAGFGNVTEFIDTDTQGVNTILASLGLELGISIFLTTEERAATINSTKELKSASMMSYFAKIRQTAPRDVGYTAFLAKSAFHDPQAVIVGSIDKVVVDTTLESTPDPKGCFRIGVNHQKGLILCEQTKPDNTKMCLASTSASVLVRELVKNEQVSFLDHAAYLGGELMKAEICLKLGHNYIQNEDWDLM